MFTDEDGEDGAGQPGDYDEDEDEEEDEDGSEGGEVGLSFQVNRADQVGNSQTPALSQAGTSKQNLPECTENIRLGSKQNSTPTEPVPMKPSLSSCDSMCSVVLMWFSSLPGLN